MSDHAAYAPSTTAVETAREADAPRPPLIGEDWLSVLVGAALVGLTLLGFRTATPVQTAALTLVPVVVGALLLRVRIVPFIAGAVLLALLG